MEGPERTIKREHEEKEKTTKEELTKLESDLAIVTKKKEDLEIAWIELDNKRTAIKEMLKPFEDKEAELETAELREENQEAKTAGVKQKQETEATRWQTQQDRHKTETEKWELQNKFLEIQDKIDSNTRAYQENLNGEDEIKEKMAKLKNGLL